MNGGAKIVRLCDSALCTKEAVALVRVIEPGSGVCLAQCRACEGHLAEIRKEAAKPTQSPLRLVELPP